MKQLGRTCDCCLSVRRGVDRRDFLKTVAAGTACLALAQSAGAQSPDNVEYWKKNQMPPEKLAEWKRNVFKLTPPRIYTPKRNPAARFPLGGIGTGNFYLGVDGRMTGWSVTNSMGEFDIGEVFFALRAAAPKGKPVVRVLSTRPPQGTRGVSDIEMKGEYPIVELKYKEKSLPVEVSLKSYTPFIPLDSTRSGYPAAVFRFRVKNKGRKPLTVSIMGAMPNCVGLSNESAKGLRHPNYGGNFNRFGKKGPLRMVRLGAKAGEPAVCDRPVRIFALSNDRHFDRIWRLATRHERPDNVRIERIRSSTDILKRFKAAGEEKVVFWLENPPEDIGADFLAALRIAARDGATVVFSGDDPSLLRRVVGSSLSIQKKGQPDIVFEDFESGNFDNWKVEGTAFGKSPQSGTQPNQQPVDGFLGKGLVNSYTAGDTPTGRMISKEFTIERPLIRFLIGGGADPQRTCIRLVVGGKVVRSATGRNREHLDWKVWDVREFMGKKAHLEIIDEASGGWGHINVDQIVFTENAVDDKITRAMCALLPAVFSNITYHREPIRIAKGDALPSLAMDELEFDGWTEYADLDLLDHGEVVLKTPRGEPLILRRKIGNGSVWVVGARILSNPWAAGRRSRALALLAALAGAKAKPCRGLSPDSHSFGEIVLATTAPGKGAVLAWEDPAELTAKFSSSDPFAQPREGEQSEPTPPGVSKGAALAATVRLAPGEEASIPFLLAWHFPNRVFSTNGKRIGVRYSTVWRNAEAVAIDLAQNLAELEELTERFRKTFYDSTLPYWLLDCLTSQMSTARIQGVCFWMENGIFAGWEGNWCCCQPTCTHVWGYEQTLAHIFPDLERSMRYVDYKPQQRPDGGINNRVEIPIPDHPSGERPFTDGHSSCVLKAYRETLLCSDDKWFDEYWPHIKKAVEYLVGRDGKNPDGIIEDEQWHTYDVAAYGPNPFLGSYYLAALRAGEEMAKRAGDFETARRWRRIFERGSKRLVELCWNGEYFQQNYPDYKKRPYQWGPGCLADQLIGQWWAHQLGLGYLLPPEKVRKALASIFKYNWLSDLFNWRHHQRWFADGHDKGLLCCTWPKGGRPARPILYCDEVWTGVEYEVAALMIYEGMLEEAFCIVKGARERYNGQARTRYDHNPWDEKECGGHYARAMSSWSVLLALSGFLYDGPRARMAYSPKLTPEKFKCFFSTAEGWGSLGQTRTLASQQNRIHLAFGRLKLRELALEVPFSRDARDVAMRVAVGDRILEPRLFLDGHKATLLFDEPVVLNEGETLEVEFRWA